MKVTLVEEAETGEQETGKVEVAGIAAQLLDFTPAHSSHLHPLGREETHEETAAGRQLQSHQAPIAADIHGTRAIGGILAPKRSPQTQHALSEGGHGLFALLQETEGAN